MGRRVEKSMDWMNDVARVISLNIRKGSEHTVEYENTEGNYCIVRIPVALLNFISMCEYAGMNVRKAA